MKPRENLVAFLATLRHFTGLSSDELDSLGAVMDIQHHPDGHVFIAEGERADGIYVMMMGEVEVVREREGREDLVNHMLVGDLFGLVAMIDKGPRSASCRARGAAKVAKLPRRAFMKLFNTSAPIAFAFQRALTTQLARDFRALDKQIRAELDRQRDR